MNNNGESIGFSENSSERYDEVLRGIYEDRGEKTVRSYEIKDNRHSAPETQPDPWDSFSDTPEATEKWRIDELNNIENMLKSGHITPEKAEQYRQEINAKSEAARNEIKEKAKTKELDDAKVQINKLSVENIQLKKEFSQATEEIANLSDENTKLKEKLAELENKMSAQGSADQVSTSQTLIDQASANLSPDQLPVSSEYDFVSDAGRANYDRAKKRMGFKEMINRAKLAMLAVISIPLLIAGCGQEISNAEDVKPQSSSPIESAAKNGPIAESADDIADEAVDTVLRRSVTADELNNLGRNSAEKQEFKSLTGYEVLDSTIDGSFSQYDNIGCYESEGKTTDYDVGNPNLVLEAMGVDPSEATAEQRGDVQEYFAYSMAEPAASVAIAGNYEGFEGLTQEEAEAKIENMSKEDKAKFQDWLKSFFDNTTYHYETGNGTYRNQGILKDQNGNKYSSFVTSDLTGVEILVGETAMEDGSTIRWMSKEDCGNSEDVYVVTTPDGTETIVSIPYVPSENSTPTPDPDPDPEKPDPEKLDPEKPDPEKPDPEKPDPEKPDPEKPDPEKPDPGPTHPPKNEEAEREYAGESANPMPADQSQANSEEDHETQEATGRDSVDQQAAEDAAAAEVAAAQAAAQAEAERQAAAQAEAEQRRQEAAAQEAAQTAAQAQAEAEARAQADAVAVAAEQAATQAQAEANDAAQAAAEEQAAAEVAQAEANVAAEAAAENAPRAESSTDFAEMANQMGL